MFDFLTNWMRETRAIPHTPTDPEATAAEILKPLADDVPIDDWVAQRNRKRKARKEKR